MEHKKLKKQFSIMVICFGISALSVLLMPMTDYDGTSFQETLGYVSGGLFWAGMLAGIIMNILLLAGLNKKADYLAEKKKGIAIFSVFQTEKAKVWDVLLIISIIAAVVSTQVWLIDMVVFVIIMMLVLSLYMHCIFNGKVFMYMVNKEIIKDLKIQNMKRKGAVENGTD